MSLDLYLSRVRSSDLLDGTLNVSLSNLSPTRHISVSVRTHCNDSSDIRFTQALHAYKRLKRLATYERFFVTEQLQQGYGRRLVSACDAGQRDRTSLPNAK